MKKDRITIIVTGLTAAAIEEAEHASFYGIHGDNEHAYQAQRSARKAIKSYIEANKINWQSAQIISANSIDTTGTKCPYKARLTFDVEHY